MSRAQVAPERVAEILAQNWHCGMGRRKPCREADVPAADWCYFCTITYILTALSCEQERADAAERQAVENAVAAQAEADRASAVERQLAALEGRLATLTQSRDAALAAAQDWLLCMDGIKHDPRCSNHFMGDEQNGPCLRCKVDERDTLVAERDALKQARDSALAAHKTDRLELHAIASRYEAALVRIRDNSGDPIVEGIAARALGGEEG